MQKNNKSNSSRELDKLIKFCNFDVVDLNFDHHDICNFEFHNFFKLWDSNLHIYCVTILNYITLDLSSRVVAT